MCSTTEQTPSEQCQPTLDRAAGADNRNVNPRRRKEVLLPQISQLALDGHSGESIARKLGIPKRTVNHWLQKVRQKWTADVAEGTARMMAVALARLDSIYREAMEEWRQSQRDIEVRFVESSEAAGGDPKKKSSVRTQPQYRNASLLAKAAGAVMASCRLMGCAAPNPPAPAPTSPQTSTDDDWDQDPELDAETVREHRIWLEFLKEDGAMSFMDADDLREVAWRLRNVIGANGGSIPAALEDRDLDFLSPYELQVHRARLLAAINALPPIEDLPEDEESSPPDPLPKEET